jgi:hypothetical protein
MSIQYNPTLNFKVTGSAITPVDMSTTFNLDLKAEKTYSLQDTTNEIELDFSNVTNKKFLILNSNQDFILHCYKTITAPISEEVFSYSFDIIIRKDFGFTLHTNDDFFDSIDKFTISTGSLNMIKVNVACYGEVVSV